MKKRYQYQGKNGVEWTDWFKPFNESERPEIQLKSKVILYNEYKD